MVTSKKPYYLAIVIIYCLTYLMLFFFVSPLAIITPHIHRSFIFIVCLLFWNLIIDFYSYNYLPQSIRAFNVGVILITVLYLLITLLNWLTSRSVFLLPLEIYVRRQHLWFFYLFTLLIFIIIYLILFLYAKKSLDTARLFLESLLVFAGLRLSSYLFLAETQPLINFLAGLPASTVLLLSLAYLLLFLTFLFLFALRSNIYRPFSIVFNCTTAVFSLMLIYSIYSHGHAFLTLDLRWLINLILSVFSLFFFLLSRYQKCQSNSDSSYSLFTRQNIHFLWKILLIFDFVLLILKRISFYSFMQYVFALFIYYILNLHLQKTLANKNLLNQEQALKHSLESLLRQKNQHLLTTNHKLKRLSITDSLTGLYNRQYFNNLIDYYVRDDNQHFSLFYIDLNRFKTVNDLYGHAIGDQLLVTIAERFKAKLPLPLVVSRIGGDEFGILQPTTQKKLVEQFADFLTTIIQPKILIDDYEFTISASIGIAIYPDDALDRDNLLKHAALAMQQAKKPSAQKSYIFYSSIYSSTIRRKNRIANLLLSIDYDREFSLHYQPQFDINHQLIGMEALLRWYHDSDGFISPGEFIPIAEENGSIIQITNWVFRSAIRQINHWNQPRITQKLLMGVNISPLLLNYRPFYKDLKSFLHLYQLDPQTIDLEITETLSLENNYSSESILASLEEMGFSISIDDFGTGYSTLDYIKRFKINRIKIAKQLVDMITYHTSSKSIVRSIILMARELGLKTIAEGVETSEQLNLLKEWGCHQIQGYYWGKPVPAKKFEQMYLTDPNKTTNL